MLSSKLKQAAKNFHENEAGLEALQVVMIVAVAAVCLIAIKAKWPAIKTFFNEGADDVVAFDA